jgi:hypothetical protein
MRIDYHPLFEMTMRQVGRAFPQSIGCIAASRVLRLTPMVPPNLEQGEGG